MNLFAWLRKRASLRRERAIRPEVVAFERAAAALGPDDIAIDCGANVGKFTLPMAATGATVYAFEPNPEAFAELQKKTAAHPNIILRQAAVTTHGGTVKLFFHKWAKEDPVHWSTGSSLLADKNNISPDQYTEVEAVDFSAFLRDELGDGPVRLLKMDIEGAEVAVLNQLLDAGQHTRITEAYVEVHDRRSATLREPTRLLRERLQSLGATQFCLDWR